MIRTRSSGISAPREVPRSRDRGEQIEGACAQFTQARVELGSECEKLRRAAARVSRSGTGWRRSSEEPPPAELQARIDRLALEGENSEDAFVHASERLSLHEPFEPFDSQRELPQRERALSRKPALAEPRQVLGQRVLRSIDDPEVLAASALYGRARVQELGLSNRRLRLIGNGRASGWLLTGSASLWQHTHKARSATAAGGQRREGFHRCDVGSLTLVPAGCSR